MNAEIEIIEDEVFVSTPLPQYGGNFCTLQLVMTKDIFQECYKRWIKSQENKEKAGD